MSDSSSATRSILRIQEGRATRIDDPIVVERALEMRLDGRPLAVTLRTPGHDRELAIGFLAGESLIRSRDQVLETRAAPAACDDQPDTIEIRLAPDVRVDWTRLERHFAATAACGLCGRAHLESLRAGLTPLPPGPAVPADRLIGLADRVREGQLAFGATGGIHAAAWVDAGFEVRVIREDVGRHNAVDKVAGWLLESERYPVNEGLLWVSGRAGAEIVLKAARARLPIVAAVGAPSTLAIEIAEAAGMTLVGFLRAGRMNVYSGPERIRAEG